MSWTVNVILVCDIYARFVALNTKLCNSLVFWQFANTSCVHVTIEHTSLDNQVMSNGFICLNVLHQSLAACLCTTSTLQTSQGPGHDHSQANVCCIGKPHPSACLQHHGKQYHGPHSHAMTRVQEMSYIQTTVAKITTSPTLVAFNSQSNQRASQPQTLATITTG